ncbi:MAG: hypothetical protein WA913_05520, partial [Pricia sp.]
INIRIPDIQMFELVPSTSLAKTVAPEMHPKKIAILYKMKENIIRRELSFIPGKKWRKWA